MSGKRKFRYFDADTQGGPAHEPEGDPGPSYTASKNSHFKKASSEKFDRANDGNLENFKKKFESTFGYVSDRRRDDRQHSFPKKFRLNWKKAKEQDGAGHGAEDQQDYASNENWSNGRYGLSDDSIEFEAEPNSGPTAPTFPNELVAYLRSISASLEGANLDAAVLMREKCLEECTNREVLLLSFESSCRVVEKVFDGFRPAAVQFNQAVLSLTEDRLLEALLCRSTCHTLESFLYVLSTSLDYQVIERWTKMAVQFWTDIIPDSSASHFVRSLFRIIVGLPRKGTNRELTVPVDAQSKKDILKEFNANKNMKTCFQSLVNTALNFSTMKDQVNTETGSLVLQDAVDYDWLVKNGRRRDFLIESLEEPRTIISQWKDKYGSHLWQVLVKRVDEDARQALFHCCIGTNLAELAQHPFANFVVDAFVSSANSEELVTDIFDELLDSIPELCEKGKFSVINGLVQTCANHEDKQKDLLKRLRRNFFCSKKSARNLFVAKVFTMETAKIDIVDDGKLYFDVRFGDIHGSLLLQELFKLKHNRTVTMSFMSLSKKTLFDLACSDKGTFLVQAFLNSPHVSQEDKITIGDIFRPKWSELMGDDYGSFVFDALWDSEAFTIVVKRNIMSKLCGEPSEGKSNRWRLMAKKLDIRSFKEDRKKWVRVEEARVRSLKKNC